MLMHLFDQIIFSFFVGFHRSRWLAVRLTVRLKGAGMVRAWVKSRQRSLITSMTRMQLI
jgi:hypothetical protein